MAKTRLKVEERRDQCWVKFPEETSVGSSSLGGLSPEKGGWRWPQN